MRTDTETETEGCYAAGFEDGRGPRAKERRRPPETRKGRPPIVPQNTQKEYSLADTLI